MRLRRPQRITQARRRPARLAALLGAVVLATVAGPLAAAPANAAPTVVTDFSHDFEGGQTHGWAGNGVTAEQAEVGAGAHGGTGVLSVHDKTGWGVALRDLRSTVQPGVEYTLEAWVRAAAADGQLSLTVNAGTDYQNSGTYQVPITSSGWTKLSRTYTATAGQPLPEPLQTYFEAAADFVPFYVDDVTLTHVDAGDPGDPTDPGEATRTLVANDFEDGSAQGWGPRGPVTVAASTEQAHGGTQSLKTTGRTANWNGPALNLLGRAVAGTEYTFSAWVRMVSGTDSVKLTMQASVDGGAATFTQITTPAETTADGWAQLTGVWTAPANATELTLYAEGASATSEFYLDDVAITFVGPADGTRTLVANDFEDGTAQGWGPRGSVTVAASTEQAHGGTQSLKTTGRTANWHGPAFNLLGRVATGTRYTFTAWVRMVSGTDTVGATVQKTIDGTTSWDSVTPRPEVTADGWTELTGEWTAPANATELTLYVEGASATSEFYLDDVLVTYTGDGTPPTDPPLPAGLERVESFGPNPGNLRMYVHVPAALQARAPIVVASHYCTGSAPAFYTGSGFGVREIVQASDRLGFIMIFPEATRDGRCFDSASPEALTRGGGSDPVSVKSMVDHVQATYATDPDRVFAVGASSGAMLTQVLLGNYPDVFAAGVSFMGVPHSCFATGSSSNLWSNECAQGTRVRTAQEWGDLVRGAYPGYQGRRPRVQLWHGTEDDIIAYSNLGEGVKQWTNVHGVPATPVASRQVEGTWTRDRYGSGAVQAPVEAITVNGNGHDLPRPEMHPYALAFFGLDEPVFEPDPDPSGNGTQTLLEHGFESGTTQGWTARGGTEVVANSTAAAHTGSRSLAVTGRTQNWNAPIVNLLGRVQQGTSYRVSAWVRLADGNDAGRARITVERRLGGTPTYEGISSLTAVTDDGWTQLTGTYILADEVDFLRLYVETEGIEDFFLDDVKITYLPTLPIQLELPSLKDEYARHWPVTGAAVGVPQLVGDRATLLKKHFNSVTPENALKWDAIHPRPGVWNWTEADRVVQLAEQNGLRVYGHVLAWHSQLPDWVFQDDGGNPLPVNAESRQLVLDRLSDHIRTVVGRYQGRIYAWDAVNEVIDDADGVTYRDSKYFQYTGLDFIRTAFRVAHEADPAAELCINDYNSTRPVKGAKYYALVKRLLAEGVPVDCVGHQVHVNIVEPAIEAEETIGRFKALGVRQRITEMDVSVYDNDTDAFDEIPEANRLAQQAQYKALFEAFLAHADGIDSVTTWGLADDRTWLSTFPISRLNTPLLFDNRLQAKPVFHTLVDLARGWTPESAPAGLRTVRLDPRRPVLPASGGQDVTVTLSSPWCLSRGARIVADSRAVAGPGTDVSADVTRTRSGTYTARLRLTATSPVGDYDVFLVGADCRGRRYAPQEASARLGLFTALNRTTVTLDVRPEPVRRGQPVVAAGTVRHLVGGRLTGWAGVAVVVEFRPRGEESYVAVGTPTTDARGAYTLSSPATADGTWRVRYAGSADHAPASATDYVDVR